MWRRRCGPLDTELPQIPCRCEWIDHVLENLLANDDIETLAWRRLGTDVEFREVEARMGQPRLVGVVRTADLGRPQLLRPQLAK